MICTVFADPNQRFLYGGIVNELLITLSLRIECSVLPIKRAFFMDERYIRNVIEPRMNSLGADFCAEHETLRSLLEKTQFFWGGKNGIR